MLVEKRSGNNREILSLPERDTMQSLVQQLKMAKFSLEISLAVSMSPYLSHPSASSCGQLEVIKTLASK